MTTKKSNEAQFYLFCTGQSADTFEVLSFTGEEEISSGYKFDIMVLSPSADIVEADIIGKGATLFLYRDGEYFPVSGIVTRFAFEEFSTDHATYSISIVSRLQLLEYTVQTRVFLNKNVPDIIREVFTNANIPTSYFTLNCTTSNYPVQEYVVQYQESDLDFISRLMERAGIWYFFTEPSLLHGELDGNPSTEHLCITDAPADFVTISGDSTVVFRGPSGLNEPAMQITASRLS